MIYSFDSFDLMYRLIYEAEVKEDIQLILKSILIDASKFTRHELDTLLEFANQKMKKIENDKPLTQDDLITIFEAIENSHEIGEKQ